MSQRGFLYSLQLIDSQIDKKLDRIGVIEKSLRDNDIVNAAKKLKEDSEKKVSKKKSEIRVIEDQTNSIIQKKKQSENDLYGGKIRNPKELQSIQEEISSLKKRISQLEDELFNLMVETESLEEELGKADAILKDRLSTRSSQVMQLEREKAQLISEINVLNIEKQPIESHIDPELFAKYQHLRKIKNRLAVVVVEENACTGCGNSITLAEIQKIKSPIDEYYCQVCKRILYYG